MRVFDSFVFIKGLFVGVGTELKSPSEPAKTQPIPNLCNNPVHIRLSLESNPDVQAGAALTPGHGTAFQ